MLKNYHQHIYFFGLVLLALALPLSVFLISVAQIILLLNWILENNFREKWTLATTRHKSIFAFIIIYLVHLIGLAYSSDWDYGIHDLKIKLPLLVIPLIIGTSRPVAGKKIKYVLLSFCTAVLISTLISTGKLFGWWGKPVLDIRDISIFISHIRLALMMNMAIFILVHLISKSRSTVAVSSMVIAIVWFIFFLFLLKSLTGIIIFMVLVLFFGLRWVATNKNMMAKWFAVVGAAAAVLIVTSYITNAIGRFNHLEENDFSNPALYTANGNQYMHNPSSTDMENGFLTWMYVCDKELESVWNKRSQMDYKGTDLKGQELRFTLIRYLTSRGLRKDSAGLMSLHPSDIQNIEQGMANYIYSQKFSFYPRIYQLLWEIHQYKNGGNPSGHSFTQRLEYLKTAKNIIHSHFFFGVGTGDVAQAFKKQYENDGSQLALRWRLRAHNQWITFLLTFGIIGFIIVATSLAVPVILERKWNNYYILLFLVIGFSSFLNEDTLETHAGISFFSFFYALFLYTEINDHH